MREFREPESIDRQSLSIDSKIPPLSSSDFDIIRNMIESKSGIKLASDKVTLVENRLRARLNALNMTSYSEYLQYLGGQNPAEIECFIDALTTHTTQFFRESKHFTLIEKLLANGGIPCDKRLDIWCAACSTGEEAYTLAIVLEELCEAYPYLDYRILASDISEASIEATKNGIFDKSRSPEIPPHLLIKYFQQNASRTKIRAKKILRSKIKVRKINLADHNLQVPIKFDIVFLRNVLIYFCEETIERLALRVYEGLNPGGHLFIGFAENIGSSRDAFENVDISVFKRKK